jgi:hypothetical protein
MNTRFALTLAVVMTFAPAFASAEQKPPSVHMRPQLFHDRTPHVHAHGSKLHRPA